LEEVNTNRRGRDRDLSTPDETRRIEEPCSKLQGMRSFGIFSLLVLTGLLLP
jgi:hypothetical protein